MASGAERVALHRYVSVAAQAARKTVSASELKDDVEARSADEKRRRDPVSAKLRSQKAQPPWVELGTKLEEHLQQDRRWQDEEQNKPLVADGRSQQDRPEGEELPPQCRPLERERHGEGSRAAMLEGRRSPS